jgi:sec-independent protein translocase protein TatC
MPILKARPKGARNVSDPEEFRAPLVEHLEELRTRLLRIIGLLVVGWVIGWYLLPPLYSFLNTMIQNAVKGSIGPNRYTEAFRNATEPFMLKFKLSFLIGLVLVFPLIVLQIWGFIEPGLKPSERKPFRRMAPLSLVLFAMGAGFCWIILPSAIGWFAVFLNDFNANLIQEPGTMVFFVLKMMLAFGIGFQLPLIVFALGALGLLTAETLVEYWRQAATFIFVASAVLTPSNDAFSMLMMAVPLVILFLISVWAVKIVQRKKKKAEDEAEDEPYDDLE